MNVYGYVTDKTSYGLVTCNVVKALNDPCVSLFPNGSASNTLGHFEPYIGRALRQSYNFNYYDSCLSISHQFSMGPSIGKGPRIGYTFFEMDRLTPVELHNLNSLDGLLVASEWAKNICLNSGVKCLVGVAPLGYDPDIFTCENYIPKKCVFLSIGKWEVRKQQDNIVGAFNRAFTNSDNVELWLMMANPFLSIEHKEDEYRSSNLGHKIRMIGRVNTQSELNRIINQSYCFVAPSLAEGFNLEALEAMAAGRQIIATYYSGHTEYIKSEFANLIVPNGTEKAIDNKWFNTSELANCGNWATYDHNDLVDLMGKVYREFCSGPRINYEAIDHAKNFTWANTVSKIKDFVKDVG